MANYKTDLEDIYFNLFKVLKTQNNTLGLEEQDIRGVVDEYAKFVENEVFPTREAGDVEGVHLKEGVVTTPECFKAALQNYYANGWFGLGVSEELGGAPVPEAVRVACSSLFIGANVAFSMYPMLTLSAFNVINKIGSDEQRQVFLEKMLSGEWGGTMCLTEASAGSDVGALRSTATPLGDNRYKIKGTKIFISSGESDLYANNIHLVLARTPEGEKGTKGISLFIVPKRKINADGSLGELNDVVCSKVEEKMGIHASATCVLNFGENDNCEGQLIGKEFEGMTNMFIMMNEARLLCGVQGESQACLAYEMALQYAKERVQFGEEIIQHPDVKRMLLKMRAMSRGLRALDLYTANLFDRETEKGVMDEIGLLTPICKVMDTDAGFQVCVDAMQILGGYGYCSEYGVEQFVRDCKIASIYEGTNGIQSIDFLSRKILRDQGKALTALLEKVQAPLKHPAVRAWGESTKVYTQSLQAMQQILKKYTQLVQAKKNPQVLESATDFTRFASNLFVAWRLLVNAVEAQEQLGAAGSSDKFFLEGKVADFQVFAQHYLTDNHALAERILGFESSLVQHSL